LEENSTGEGNEGAEAEVDNVEREEIELLRERDRPCECFGMKLFKLLAGAPPPILNDSNLCLAAILDS
jgi:hypothetical protein